MQACSERPSSTETLDGSSATVLSEGLEATFEDAGRARRSAESSGSSSSSRTVRASGRIAPRYIGGDASSGAIEIAHHLKVGTIPIRTFDWRGDGETSNTYRFALFPAGSKSSSATLAEKMNEEAWLLTPSASATHAVKSSSERIEPYGVAPDTWH